MNLLTLLWHGPPNRMFSGRSAQCVILSALWIVLYVITATPTQATAQYKRHTDARTGLSYELPGHFKAARSPDRASLLWQPPGGSESEGFAHFRTPMPKGVSTQGVLSTLVADLTRNQILKNVVQRNTWVLGGPGLRLEGSVPPPDGPLGLRALALVHNGWMHLFVLTFKPAEEPLMATAFAVFEHSLEQRALRQPATGGLAPPPKTEDGRPVLHLSTIPNPASWPTGSMGEQVRQELLRLIKKEGRYRLADKAPWELTVIISEVFEMEGTPYEENTLPRLEAMARLSVALSQNGAKVFEGDFSHIDHGQEGEVLPYGGRDLFTYEDDRQQGLSRALSRNLQSLVELLRQRVKVQGRVLSVSGREGIINLGGKVGLAPGQTVLLQKPGTGFQTAEVLWVKPLYAAIRTLEGAPATGGAVWLTE